jgi:hypothetical protein
MQSRFHEIDQAIGLALGAIGVPIGVQKPSRLAK